MITASEFLIAKAGQDAVDEARVIINRQHRELIAAGRQIAALRKALATERANVTQLQIAADLARERR